MINVKKYCFYIILGGILLVLTGGVLFTLKIRSQEEPNTVMVINGQNVGKEEYQMILSRYQAQVKSRYSTEEVNQEDFWTKKVDGTMPLEIIMELAKEDLIRKKTIASMAKEEGIEADVDYNTLKSLMEDENSVRADKLDSDEVVYGLASYSVDDFYQYTYSELEMKLIEKLKQKQDLTEEELEEAYKENIEDYRYETAVKMLIGETILDNEQQLMEAADAMRAEANQEELETAWPDITFYELEMNDLDTQEGKSGIYSMRWTLASSMQKGEVSDFLIAGQNMFVMKCLDREENGVLPFEKIKNILESQMRTKLAKQSIENEMKEVKVEENSSQLREAAKEGL